MNLSDPIAYWTAFSVGSVVVISGSYYLGRVDAKNRIKKIRQSWVAVADHGGFGLEPVQRFRSRARAESYRRRLMHTEQLEIVSYDTWLDFMIQRIHSASYWDVIMRLEAQVENINRAIIAGNDIETAILPQVDEKHSQLNEIASGVAELGKRMNHTDEVLRGVMEMIDAFRDHMVDLDHTMTDHMKKIGHVTAEMEAIRDEPQLLEEFEPPKYSSLTGGSLGGQVRTVAIRLSGVAERRESVQSEPEKMESGDSADENDGGV